MERMGCALFVMVKTLGMLLKLVMRDHVPILKTKKEEKQKMKCDCIKEIEKCLEKETGDPNVMLDVTFNIKGKMYPAIHYFLRKKRKDGSLGLQQIREIIVPTFCPFCGEKYE